MNDIRRQEMWLFTIVLTGFFFLASQGAGWATPARLSIKGPEASTGQKIASGALTMVYFPVKAAYAGLGGIVGGLTYVFSGGDKESADIIWTPTIEGTYVLTTEHIWGDEPIEFFGGNEYRNYKRPV